MISYNEKEGTVYLKSPTTGQVIRIRNPKAKIRSSENALLNLKHIEDQINSQSVLPDFGYMQDNYIIDRGYNQSSWKKVTELIGNKDKFQWLMNYIQVKNLKRSIQNLEESKSRENLEKGYAVEPVEISKPKKTRPIVSG